MSKFTRYKYGVANERGTVTTIAANTTITESQILRTGQFWKINGAYTLTLPAASSALKGVSVYVHSNNASGKVAVAAGFGGGGASYDTVTVGAYNTVEFWCDGSYWYALSTAVAGS
jgi:hypothetical protein